MNYPTKDSITAPQIQEYEFHSSNSQILNPTRNLGSDEKDDKFDIATNDNKKNANVKNIETKDKYYRNVKNKFHELSSPFIKFFGFMGPGYGKSFIINSLCISQELN